MGLYRRGKIYWFSIMQNGKRLQLSTKTDNRKIAKVIYAKTLNEIIEGNFFQKQKAQKTIFREVSEKYLGKYGKQRDPYSVKHLLCFFGEMTIAQIDSEAVEDYIEKRLASGSAFSTVYKEFALGRRMFNVARKKWKWTKENPFTDVEFPSFDNQRDRWLTLQEEPRLLNSSSQEWLRDIIIFAIHTGCRMGEILLITWKDNIDMDRMIITVMASKGGIKKVIPMSNTLYQMLLKRSRVHHISGKVFPVTHSALKDAFQRAVKKADIEDFHFHDLRHTFATRLIQNGVDLYKVQKLLGHKTLRMTERYAHHYPESLRSSMSVLDNCYNFATVQEEGGCTNDKKSFKIKHGSV